MVFLDLIVGVVAGLIILRIINLLFTQVEQKKDKR